MHNREHDNARADLVEVREAMLPPQCEVLLNEGHLQLHAQCPSMQEVATNCHTICRACLRIHPAACMSCINPP